MRKGMGEDFIFAPEACQRRNARNSNRAYQKQSIGPWDFCAEAAHLANVLFARERVDHRSGCEKQEGLEEGMGYEMEHGSRIGPDPAPEEHVSELAHRRIGQNAFDVRLHKADGSGKQRCESADDAYDRHGSRRQIEHGMSPTSPLNTSSDHYV